ncbi:MAG: DNA-binding protein, partial [Chloroflexota bacterium]|nr:DNA-binding protein [Chloroflexota bacterium]
MPAGFRELTAGRGFVGRLETGSDLVDGIERFCLEQGIVAGQVTVIGAVRRAAFAYYEQEDHRYLELSSDTHHEIVGFTGNISLRDDRPFLHAHATFADASGACVGGHLLRGCEVFAAEVMIREIGGVTLVRQPDE